MQHVVLSSDSYEKKTFLPFFFVVFLFFSLFFLYSLVFLYASVCVSSLLFSPARNERANIAYLFARAPLLLLSLSLPTQLPSYIASSSCSSSSHHHHRDFLLCFCLRKFFPIWMISTQSSRHIFPCLNRMNFFRTTIDLDTKNFSFSFFHSERTSTSILFASFFSF